MNRRGFVASKPSTKSTTSTMRFCLLALLGAWLAGLAGCAQTGENVATREIDRPLVGYPGQQLALMNRPGTVWAARRIGPKEYFAQPNDWTCSASSYIMVYRSLTGRDLPLKEVVARTGARKGVGAENSRVVEAMKMLGPEFEVVSGQSSAHPTGESRIQKAEKAREHATLTRLLREGYLVILNFRNPEDHGGHYGVLQGLNGNAIQIADPYYGRISVMPWKNFDFRSGYSDPVLHGWYVAARPNPWFCLRILKSMQSHRNKQL